QGVVVGERPDAEAFAEVAVEIEHHAGQGRRFVVDDRHAFVTGRTATPAKPARVADSGARVVVLGARVADSGARVVALGACVVNSGAGFAGPGARVVPGRAPVTRNTMSLHPQHGTQSRHEPGAAFHPRAATRTPGLATRAPETTTRAPETATRLPASATRGPETATRVSRLGLPIGPMCDGRCCRV